VAGSLYEYLTLTSNILKFSGSIANPDSPVSWTGDLIQERYFLYQDPRFAELTNGDRLLYLVYRARQRPHWRIAAIDDGDIVEDGEFLIYRPYNFLDDYCYQLAVLVEALHFLLHLAPHTVPSRYRTLESHYYEVVGVQPLPTSSGISDSDSESSYDTDECDYFMINPAEELGNDETLLESD